VEKSKKLEFADVLGIIVIILIVIGITVPVIMSLVRNSKVHAAEAAYSVIIDGALEYASDNTLGSFTLSELLTGIGHDGEIVLTYDGETIDHANVTVYVSDIPGYNDVEDEINLRTVTLDFGFDEATDFDLLDVNGINVYDLENVIGDNNFFIYDDKDGAGLVLIDPKP
jgi:uncharacterized protein (UPF0333 family)